MNIEKQLDILKKRKDDLYKRFCKPLDLQIENLEHIKESLKKQVVCDFDTDERQAQFNRINGSLFEYPNRPEVTSWDRIENGKGI